MKRAGSHSGSAPRRFGRRVAWGAAAVLAVCSGAAGGEQLVLTEAPAYLWWHGCSPTAAMMVHGYWDAHGYADMIPGSNGWNANGAAIRNSIASLGDGDGSRSNPGTPGTGHVGDYALYGGVDDYSGPVTSDMSTVNPSGAHPNDSMADFMYTSRSAWGLGHGASYVSRVDDGLRDYAAWKGYAFGVTHRNYSAGAWSDYTDEIRLGRPVVLHVDSNGDGYVDHSITGVGYRNTRGYDEYACYDTWRTSVRWQRFRGMSSGYGWGVYAMELVYPAGSGGTIWQGSGGLWHHASSWSGGVPDSKSFTFVPAGRSARVTAPAAARMISNAGSIEVRSGLSAEDVRNVNGQITVVGPAAALSAGRVHLMDGSLTIDGGSLHSHEFHVGTFGSGTLHMRGSNPRLFVSGLLRFAPDSRFTAETAAQIRLLGGAVEIASADSDDLSGLANVNLRISTGDGQVCLLEAAGADRGAAPAGWDDNFALAALTLGGSTPGLLKLVDRVDNQPASATGEAVYVDELTLAAGGGVDLDALKLYYRNGGVPRQLVYGDAGLDGQVNVRDLAALANHYGRPNGGWTDGDFNGDGAVDTLDLAILAANYEDDDVGRQDLPDIGGFAVSSGPAPAPEPAGVVFLAAAALVLRRRRS